MDLSTYLKQSGERASAFGRRIGAKPSTISGWINDPMRGPSRAMLARIEVATGGKVSARDFAVGGEHGADRPALAGAGSTPDSVNHTKNAVGAAG